MENIFSDKNITPFLFNSKTENINSKIHVDFTHKVCDQTRLKGEIENGEDGLKILLSGKNLHLHVFIYISDIFLNYVCTS